MNPHDWDNLPFLKPKPPQQIEPRFLGWGLTSLLTGIGISLVVTTFILPSDHCWGIFSTGVNYLALAVIICPITQTPFWAKVLISTISGLFIL